MLIVRQIHGPAKGKLIIPGGYVTDNESPFAAIEREVLEEANVEASAEAIVALRYRPGNWILGIRLQYASGEPKGDQRETADAFFSGIQEALENPEITEFSKVMIRAAVGNEGTLVPINWRPVDNPTSDYELYC